MNKTTFNSVKLFLEENIKDESHFELIIESAEEILFLEEESMFLKMTSEKSNREEEFVSFINIETPQLNDRFSAMRKIVRYLVVYSEEPSEDLIKELKILNLNSYSDLSKLPDDYIQNIFYRGATEYGKFSDWIGRNREESFLFYSVLHILIQILGIESSLKILTEFIQQDISGSLRNDSRHPIETLFDAVLYCTENRDYPIEWNLTQAFSASAISN